jgi:hypothetical protein
MAWVLARDIDRDLDLDLDLDPGPCVLFRVFSLNGEISGTARVPEDFRRGRAADRERGDGSGTDFESGVVGVDKNLLRGEAD